MTEIITPDDTVRRLIDLSRQVDTAHADLVIAEQRYQQAKAELEIGLARTRLDVKASSVSTTVGEREDLALVDCQDARRELAVAETIVRAARANTNRLQTQVDLARSVGTVVRAAMSA